MTRIAVSQSNYIPWKGYFDLIHDVDRFVFYDDVQYTKNDWRNRNLVKGAKGPQWLTIPVGGNISQRICDVAIKDSRWQAKHWKTLLQLYGRAPHFGRYRPFFENVFLGQSWPSLSRLNQYLIESISREFLGVTTVFLQSGDYPRSGRRQDALINLLTALDTQVYVSGPSARSYIDPERFRSHNIELLWKDYSGYPEYAQFFAPFEHRVSVLDLLFHTGPDAAFHIWGWRDAIPSRNAA